MTEDITTQILVQIRTDIAEMRTELREEITDVRTELRAEIAELRTEVRTDIAELRNEVRTDIGELRTSVRSLQRQFASMTEIVGLLVRDNKRIDGRIAALERHLGVLPSGA